MPVKLRPPDSAGLVPRPRPNALADPSRGDVLWVSGPAGSGEPVKASTVVDALWSDAEGYTGDAADERASLARRDRLLASMRARRARGTGDAARSTLCDRLHHDVDRAAREPGDALARAGMQTQSAALRRERVDRDSRFGHA